MDEQTGTSQPQVGTGMSQGAVSQPQPPASPTVPQAPPAPSAPQSPSTTPAVPPVATSPSPVQGLPQAPPQPTPPVAPPAEQSQMAASLAYVGFGRRFVALLIDVIILVVIGMFLIGGSILAFSSALPGSGREELMGLNLVANLVMTIINWIYFVGFLASKGATPGKMVLGIKVVTASGESVSIGRAALREIIGKLISSLPLGLGYLWVIWDEKKQGWHDKIANTVVVYSK